MHLGVNLQKAFLSAFIVSEQDCGGSREYHPGDVLVHECCKLIGKHSVPEYTCGVLDFPDFLDIMTADSSLNEDDLAYYRSCKQITLERQIGSLYFVTASNAPKLFSKESGNKVPWVTGKNNGNRVEKSVYEKLQQSKQLAHLKIDGLLFYHVYADLMVLAKSNTLNKSAFDMTRRELQQHPETILDKERM